MAESDLPPRRAIIETNLAAAVGQLQVPGAAGLRADSREILSATTTIAGARFGEMEVNTYLAMNQRYSDMGHPRDGHGSSTIHALATTLYGQSIGGTNRAHVTRAMMNLFRVELQMAGVQASTGEYEAEFLDFERLVVMLRFDRQIGLRRTAPERYDPAVIGAQRDSTVKWQFADWHVEQLRSGYFGQLDWEKLRSLGGVAKMLWIMLSSQRMPFVPLAASEGLEELRLPLAPDGYSVFGIQTTRERDARRSLERGVERMMAVDSTYVGGGVEYEPGGPYSHSLTLMRRSPAPGQLELGSSHRSCAA